jgi:hypothetical protein
MIITAAAVVAMPAAAFAGGSGYGGGGNGGGGGTGLPGNVIRTCHGSPWPSVCTARIGDVLITVWIPGRDIPRDGQLVITSISSSANEDGWSSGWRHGDRSENRHDHGKKGRGHDNDRGNGNRTESSSSFSFGIGVFKDGMKYNKPLARPLSVNVSGRGITPGTRVYVVSPQGGNQLIATSWHGGSVSFSISRDPVFKVTTPGFHFPSAVSFPFGPGSPIHIDRYSPPKGHPGTKGHPGPVHLDSVTTRGVHSDCPPGPGPTGPSFGKSGFGKTMSFFHFDARGVSPR